MIAGLAVTLLKPLLSAKPQAGRAGIGPDIVHVVRLDVSVLDAYDRPVDNLGANAFHISDDGADVGIVHFDHESRAMSVTFVVDKSGSMSNDDLRATGAVLAFARACAPGTEFSVVTFGDRASEALTATTDLTAIESVLRATPPHGNSALIDGVYLGASTGEDKRDRKKVVVLISDGANFKSRYTAGDVVNLLKESDVQVYAIEIMRTSRRPPSEMGGPPFISDFCRISGGRVLIVASSDRLAASAEHLAGEIQKQYELGFISRTESASPKTRWHALHLKVDAQRGELEYHCTFRAGYIGQ